MSRYIKDTNDNWQLSSGMAPIDEELDSTSENPIQNQVVTTELNKKLPSYTNGTSDWDTVPTQNSTKPVTSGGVYSYIDTMITQALSASY